MPWVRFDDLFPIHRKVRGLSDAAFRLHVEAIFWCARNTTDGFVPTGEVSALASARRPHKFLPELVARTWHRTDEECNSGQCPANPAARAKHQMPAPAEDGWLIHDYWDYQFPKVKIERERKAKAERQKRWLDKKRKGRDASTDTSHDATGDAAPAPAPNKAGEGGPSPERASPPGPAPGGAGGDARTRALAIANCSLCDDTGYAGTRLCDHDPGSPDRAARGRALVDAALHRKADPT